MIHDFRSIVKPRAGAGIERTSGTGSGLLESTYEACLVHELTAAGIPFTHQQEIPVLYKGMQLDCGYRADIIVDGQLLLELKSVESIHPIHEAQLLTYLRLAGLKTGLLINFNVQMLKQGVHRFVI